MSGAERMYVHSDGLLSIGALVDDQSVAIVAQPLLAGHLGSHEHEVAHERFLVLLHVSNSADGLLGDDEDVSGRLGSDVMEGNRRVVLEDLLRGDGAIHDLSEDRVLGLDLQGSGGGAVLVAVRCHSYRGARGELPLCECR